MKTDLDEVLNGVLESYSRVEPAPGAVESWMARRAQAPAPSRFLGMPAPAWAALALAFLILLGLSWYRSGSVLGGVRQPALANEQTTLQALAPNVPLTAEQKQLIQILLTNPGELATLKPGDLAKTPPKPKTPSSGQPH